MAAFKHKKLKEWMDAGIINQNIADSIQQYETTKKKGRFGNGLVNLSIFAILVGVLSIIASNWQDIPGMVKIVVHVGINIIVGSFAVFADRRGKDIWREGATLALFGLTFTLIVLIGQVYQMTGSLPNAMILWVVATTAFVWQMAKTHAVNAIWVLVTSAALMSYLFQYLEKSSDIVQFYGTLGMSVYLPLIFVWLGTSNILNAIKPVLKDILVRLGSVWLLVGASAGLAFWGYGFNKYFNDCFVIMAVGLSGMVAHAMYHNFYKDNETLKIGALFVAISFCLMCFSGFIPGGPVPVLSALLFIGYWVFIGWIGQKLDIQRLVSISIFIIAIRIFAVYIELFGTLLTTGFGLIASGLIMLGLIYAARKMNVRLTKGGHHVQI